MSILIKGANMPKNCWECLCNDLCCVIAEMGGACPFTERVIERNEFDAHSGIHPDCPLVEIPPHGRLIDADKFKNDIPETDADCFENCRDCTLLHQEDVWDIIDDAPTVIESEEQEHE